jgi:tRNA (guanine-N7-)-methyltransferase
MSRVLKFDIPGRDFRVAPLQVSEQGWEAVFAPDLSPPLRLAVDIGFGRGEFVMEMARRCPGTAFVGIEHLFKRVLKMARRVAKSEIGNLRLLDANAELAVEELFEESSVHCFWINFPDPWPKERHAMRRLVQGDFIHELARRLEPGGELRLATDDPRYSEQFCEVLAAEPELENLFAPSSWLPELPAMSLADAAGQAIPPHASEAGSSEFERHWREKGRPLHFFSYRRRVAT